jgi:transposase
LRTQIKNKVQAILSKNGLRTPTKTAFGKKSQRYLADVAVRPCYRLALDGYLALIQNLQEQIGQVSAWIDQQVQRSPEAQLLDTMPGIGPYAALLILSEIGEIDRFPDAKHLCSYAGLVPSVYASGGKVRHGRLTKQGSKWLRWILIELALHAVNGAPQFRSLYYRVMRKHGKNAGRVAVARAMLKAIYHMLKFKETFKAMPVKKRTGQHPGVMA